MPFAFHFYLTFIPFQRVTHAQARCCWIEGRDWATIGDVH